MNRYLIPALALVLLILAYISFLGPRAYNVVRATAADQTRGTLVVTQTSAGAERLGIHKGTLVRAAALSPGDFLRFYHALGLNETVLLPVVSGSHLRMVRVPAQIPMNEDRYSISRIASAVAATFAFLLIAYLGWRKPGAMMLALLLYVAAAIPWRQPALAHLPDVLYVPLIVLVAVLVGNFPVLALASFAIRFPGDEPGAAKRRAIRVIDTIVIAGFVCDIVVQALPAATAPFTSQYTIGYEFVGVLTVVAATILSLRFALPAQRARVAIVFAAMIFGTAGYCAGVAMNYANAAGFAAWDTWYFTAMAVLVPLAVAYSILRHRVFDISFVLNRTLVFAVTSGVAVVALAIFEFVAERYLEALTRVESLAVELAIAVLVTLSIRAVHARVDHAVDTLLFRERHEQEAALRRFANAAQFYTAQAPLIRDAVAALARFGCVNGAAVYLSDGYDLSCALSTFAASAPRIDENDAAYVAMRAERSGVDAHDVATAFPGERLYPMFLAGRFAGAVAMGARAGGEAMPPDIDAAVRRVAEALTLTLAAIETASVREEIATLQQRLKEAPA